MTEVTYLGSVYGTLAALRRMLPRDRGDDRPGRLGARLPRHPAAVGLLRRQARHPGLHRLAALRADPRRQQRPGDDGADAGAEHAAVRLGEEPAAAQGAAGAADLPARGRRRGDRLGGARTAAASCCVGVPDGRGDRRQQGRARGCSIATSRGPATTRSRPTSRPSPTAPTTCGSRSPATAARTAPSTTVRRTSSSRRRCHDIAARWASAPPPPARSAFSGGDGERGFPPAEPAGRRRGNRPRHGGAWPARRRLRTRPTP